MFALPIVTDMQFIRIENSKEISRVEWYIFGTLTGIPAVHGDEAVAALDNELVEPYLARPDNDCSLIDSDDTAAKK